MTGTLLTGGGVAELLGLEVGQLVGVAGLLVLLVGGGGAAAAIWSCRLARDRQARSQLVANSYHSKLFRLQCTVIIVSQSDYSVQLS